MKLASYKDGSRDGQLVVVSRDLKTAHYATGIATRLQHLLDDWGFVSPQLQDVYDGLNQGRLRHAFPFDPKLCGAPLPRAYAWATNAGADIVRGAGDHLAGPHDEISLGSDTRELRVRAGLAAAMGDVPRYAGPGQALEGVRLLMLFSDAWLAPEADAGSATNTDAARQVLSAFAPVAVTPDELGTAWRAGSMDLPLEVELGDAPATRYGAADARTSPSLGKLVATLCRARPLAAGSIIGLTIAGGPDGLGLMLQARDRLRIHAHDADGSSVFGSIDQTVVASTVAAPLARQAPTPAP